MGREDRRGKKEIEIQTERGKKELEREIKKTRIMQIASIIVLFIPAFLQFIVILSPCLW